MDRLFLDTYALVEIASGSEKGSRILKLVKGSTEVYTGALNLYELWYLKAQAANEREADKTSLTVKALAKVMPADEGVCILAAKLKHAHHRKKIGAVDFFTAAAAFSTGSTVITGDAHFQEITEAKAKII